MSRRPVGYLLLAGGALVMLYPLAWLVAGSVKPSDEIFNGSGLWPRQPTLDNYRTGWAALGVGFGTFFANSFVISVAAVLGNLLSCSMAAYAFARLRIRKASSRVPLCAQPSSMAATALPVAVLLKAKIPPGEFRLASSLRA